MTQDAADIFAILLLLLAKTLQATDVSLTPFAM